jgi:tRNA uridine 5-carbamoylmethylation protein Kti12
VNKVLVFVVGPPESGKSRLAADLIQYLKNRLDVETQYVFTSNNDRALKPLKDVAEDFGVES